MDGGSGEAYLVPTNTAAASTSSSPSEGSLYADAVTLGDSPRLSPHRSGSGDGLSPRTHRGTSSSSASTADGAGYAPPPVIVQVACGAMHTCCVTDKGEIYLFGFGEHLLPVQDHNCFFYHPVKVPFRETVASVACGQSHVLALTTKGDVYAWGGGENGQIGQGGAAALKTPRLVLAGKNVAQVAAGRYHSLALTSFGAVYAWGCGENGQLGHHSDETVLLPKVIEHNLGTVVGQLACGEHHSCALSSTPWQKLDSSVAEWLAMEREEFALKVWVLSCSSFLPVACPLVQSTLALLCFVLLCSTLLCVSTGA